MDPREGNDRHSSGESTIGMLESFQTPPLSPPLPLFHPLSVRIRHPLMGNSEARDSLFGTTAGAEVTAGEVCPGNVSASHEATALGSRSKSHSTRSNNRPNPDEQENEMHRLMDELLNTNYTSCDTMASGDQRGATHLPTFILREEPGAESRQEQKNMTEEIWNWLHGLPDTSEMIPPNEPISTKRTP